MEEKVEILFKKYVENGRKLGCNNYAYAAGALKYLATSLAETLERIATNKTDDPVRTAKFVLDIFFNTDELEEK